MPRLSDEYGIEVDSRFPFCAREALLSVALFVLGGVAAVGSIYALTAGRTPEEYGTVLGLPSYLFFGVVLVDLGFLLAAGLALRLVFRDLSLDPVDPARGGEDG